MANPLTGILHATSVPSQPTLKFAHGHATIFSRQWASSKIRDTGLGQENTFYPLSAARPVNCQYRCAYADIYSVYEDAGGRQVVVMKESPRRE
jgi:hypothetical protein